ncbi:hypothetical protein TNCV_1046141 [Trichonephila clavipes]|nr:hypothetical protein TNCV_1046141 [Trichonephila clavipes]
MDDNAPCWRSSCRTALREQTLGSSLPYHQKRFGSFDLLQDEWVAMPQQLIDKIIFSMGRESCLAVRGDHIPY